MRDDDGIWNIAYYCRLRAIVLDVQRTHRASATALRAGLEARDVALRRREAVLEEAYLYQQKIDRLTYERQRDLLRETVALATIELQDATLDEIDVQGVLGFAEHVLANAARLWADAPIELKQRLQRVLFPDGLP